jgi:hypothetical protein
LDQSSADKLNETGIWQRNYRDRISRNDRELETIRKYIELKLRIWSEDDENLISGGESKTG